MALFNDGVDAFQPCQAKQSQNAGHLSVVDGKGASSSGHKGQTLKPPPACRDHEGHDKRLKITLFLAIK